MDSDEEITDSDVLDWYSGRVTEIWDLAMDTFNDVDESMAAVFRQVMESVQQRSLQEAPAAQAPASGSSASGSDGETSEQPNVDTTNTPLMVTMTSEQLMSVLEDDDDWLDTPAETEEEDPITVTLSDDKTNQLEEVPPPKNVKGVSQGNESQSPCKSSLTDSKSLVLFRAFFSVLARLSKLFIVSLIILLVSYFILAFHNPSQKLITRQIQNYIYPTMRALRLATLPWVRNYPSVSDWHEETCLIPNPWYWTRPLDCSSCSHLEDAVDVANHSGSGVDDFSSKYYHLGQPFIVRGAGQPDITVQTLAAIYETRKTIFSQGIARFQSSDSRFANLTDVLGNLDLLQQLPHLHISWRISRMGAALQLRRLFHRPDFIPLDTEVALHKYLFIDGPRSNSYQLPVTEFANVWVVQGHGRRQMQLRPSASCRNACKTISVELSCGDIMYYNWQFWEVHSAAAKNSDHLSITYVGSFY